MTTEADIVAVLEARNVRPSAVMTFEELCVFYGATRKADVLRLLRRDGVPFTTGIGGNPATTVAALHEALVGERDAGDEFDFRAAS